MAPIEGERATALVSAGADGGFVTAGGAGDGAVG